jgi:serine/threonine protein kinase
MARTTLVCRPEDHVGEWTFRPPGLQGVVSEEEGEEIEEIDLIERFRVGRLIGKGGMAQVYAATAPDGTEVALKRLHPTLSVRTSLRVRFANEIDLLARLQGSHVLKLVARGWWEDTPAYVAELCAGSVHDIAEMQPISLQQCLRMVSEMLVALDRVHALGVVHRDIKPSNVLLTESGSVRLADFGIALHPGHRFTTIGMSLCTPSFSAPDLVRDPSGAVPAHDLYSVALLIVAVTTRLNPRHLGEPTLRPRLLAALPEPIRALVERASHPEPTERFGSAAEMAIAVQHALMQL